MTMGFATKKRELPPVAKRKLIWCMILGLSLLVLDMILAVIDPILLLCKYNLRVDYGTYIHEALMKESEGVHVFTYLFNVTNAEEFQAGLDTKLKVEEVGPFTYQEIRSNELLEIDLAADVIRYSPKIHAKFLPEKSIGRPEDINVTMPNVAMLSMASKVGTFSLIPRLGFNLLTSRLKSKAIVRMPASDYLWGYDEPLIKLGNTLVPGLVNFDILGLLDRLYDKKARFLLEVSANEADRFAIRTVNHSHGLDFWGHRIPDKRTTCNTFTDAYEGIAYPTEMTPERNIRIYRNVLCRLLELDYHGPKESYGAAALDFRISNRTYTRNDATECLCNNGICQDGISDLSPCFLGLPVVLSNAHFMHADPKLYERIEGIRPDEERHGSSFVIEPKIGMALETRFSVQVSLYVRDVTFNSETSAFSDLIIPVVYFKIVQPKLKDDQIYNLKLIYVIGPALLLTIQILILLLSFGFLAYSGLTLCSHWTNSNRQVIHACITTQASVEVPLVS